MIWNHITANDHIERSSANNCSGCSLELFVQLIIVYSYCLLAVMNCVLINMYGYYLNWHTTKASRQYYQISRVGGRILQCANYL